MINAGALATIGYLVADFTFEDMLEYARRVCMDKNIVMDETVYESEMSHCARNRAIAYLLQSKGILEHDVEETLKLYTRRCRASNSSSIVSKKCGAYCSSCGRNANWRMCSVCT